nr:DUF881 domain-containing protein [Rhodococcus rhodnii]
MHGSGGSRRSRLVFGVVVVVLLALLGTAIATQVRTTDAGDALDTASPGDLLAVLDTVHRREAALRQEIASLENTLATLGAGGDPAAARDQARARLDELEIQVGAARAAGPGIVLTIEDPGRGVGPDVLLDVVQELRGAGSEAMQISGARAPALRVGVDSWVAGSPGALELDGDPISAPYTVVALGDPPTLAAAMNIPGGVVDHVARSGGRVVVDQSDELHIDSLRELSPRQYARPGN